MLPSSAVPDSHVNIGAGDPFPTTLPYVGNVRSHLLLMAVECSDETVERPTVL